MKTSVITAYLIVFVMNTVCQDKTAISKWEENSRFSFYCANKDIQATKDIKDALEMNYKRVCADLSYEENIKITVEIYPDQNEYNENINWMPGTPAGSGHRKMYLVSPLSSIKVAGIPYSERIMMAVHEYAHIIINEINSNVPVWLNEGLAEYEGSASIYEKFCEMFFERLPGIDFNKLQYSYYDVKGADIYSFSVVKFIVLKYGREKLNRILREPEKFDDILQTNTEIFSREWNDFINKGYRL